MILKKFKNELRRSSNFRLLLIFILLLVLVGIGEYLGFIVYPSKEEVPLTGQKLV